jgi:hypothetical protein
MLSYLHDLHLALTKYKDPKVTTTLGDMIYRASTTDLRLPIGGASTVLAASGSYPVWATIAAANDSLAREIAMYNSGNKAWVPCLWAHAQDWDPGTTIRLEQGNSYFYKGKRGGTTPGGYYYGFAGNRHFAYWRLPLPLTTGNTPYDLYVKGMRVGVNYATAPAADPATDYVTSITLNRIAVSGGGAEVQCAVPDTFPSGSAKTKYKTVGVHEVSFATPLNMGSFKAVEVEYNSRASVAAGISVSHVDIECFYA